MPDTLAGIWALPGLGWIVFASFLAGIVRGFAGFGTAMVYMPIAAQVLSPLEALTTLVAKDLLAPLIHIPRALRDGHPRDVRRLALGALVATPLGVLVLTSVSPDVFRWAVSLLALALLVALVSGLRYRGPLTPPMVYGTGAAGGFLCGAVGLPGPPVIMVYMASALPAAAVRANLTLYLLLADVILLVVLALGGLLVPAALALGVALTLPYLAGNWLGARLFQPEREGLYRWTAYAIIAGSAILGLPVWEG